MIEQELINIYFLPLEQSLLHRQTDFVEEEIVNEYHTKLNDLQSLTAYDLGFLKMDKGDDIYFAPNLNPFGFTYDIADTASTVTAEAKNEEIFYKKDRLIFKLSQLINLFPSNPNN